MSREVFFSGELSINNKWLTQVRPDFIDYLEAMHGKDNVEIDGDGWPVKFTVYRLPDGKPPVTPGLSMSAVVAELNKAKFQIKTLTEGLEDMAQQAKWNQEKKAQRQIVLNADGVLVFEDDGSPVPI